MGVEVRTSVFFSRLHPINRLTKRVGSSLRSGGTRIAILASLTSVGGGSRCAAAVLARRVEDRRRNRTQVRNRNLGVQQLFDVTDFASLFPKNQGYRSARLTGSARSADSVDVVLGVLRNIPVHNERDRLDVNAASGDVGSDQYAVVSAAESLHGRLALGQGAVGVEFTGVVTHFANDDRKLAGAVAGTGKDQRRTLFVQQQLLKHAALIVVADVGDFLLDQFTGGSLRRDFDAGGVSHVA
jgi:hypothetical protein